MFRDFEERVDFWLSFSEGSRRKDKDKREKEIRFFLEVSEFRVSELEEESNVNNNVVISESIEKVKEEDVGLLVDLINVRENIGGGIEELEK